MLKCKRNVIKLLDVVLKNILLISYLQHAYFKRHFASKDLKSKENLSHIFKVLNFHQKERPD